MHTLRLRSLPSIKEWRVYCLRYPLVEWVIYGMWAFVGFTALQNLWGGIELRWESSRFWFAADTADPWYELGTSLGFWGMLFMGLNFILAARWQWVEDLTGGLDRSYQLHAQVGTTALIFLILHLLVLAVQAIPDQQVLAQYLVPFVDTHYTLGMVGVIGLGLLVALTLWVKLPYRRWLQSHQLMGVPFLAGSLHAILLQMDWYLMAILGVGCYAWLYRLGLYRRWAPPSAGKLVAVTPQPGVTELQIQLDRPFAAQPGQFVFFNVRQTAAPLSDEPHPFSISAIVDTQTVRISAKALGDYTRSLPSLQPGDRVALSGPHGRFGARRRLASGPLLWVAGGIGVTPFLSMLQAEQTLPMPGQPLTFVWSVKNRQEALYATEIATQVQRLPHATFRLHLSDEEGYLTARQLFEQCRQPAALTVFLCGPPAMMHKLKSQFRQMGLRRLSLITEEFALR